MKNVRVGMIGTGWISEVHVQAFRTIPYVEIVCQHSLDEVRGKMFHDKYGVPEFVRTFDDVLKRKDVDVLTIALPNCLHHPFALKALQAGKHVIVEKPLCLTLPQADELLDTAKKNGLVIGYAEELCYVPKYVHAKRVADTGGLGKVFFVRQHEKHSGPYSPWFFKADEAGGGILMDMGCHAIECCRWLLGKPAVKSVYCQADTFVHGAITQLDDHIIMLIEFANGAIAEVESSWTLKGGMRSHLEIQGSQGVALVEMLQDGNGVKIYSEKGYYLGDFIEGASEGWHYPEIEWLWNNGYPQEMKDFIDCIRTGGAPLESGADGKVVLEIMIAGYLSAATGRKITFPFDDPADYGTPVEIWLRAKAGR
jgi:predicted dehydrogenase